MKTNEIVKVTIKGREDIGVVTDCRMLDEKPIMTADFGFFTVSAPPEFFTLIITREAA